MPPHPTHRLNAWLVPSDPEREPGNALTAGLATLQAERGETSQRWGHDLLPGGWLGVRLDQPAAPHLYGNKQGGFQVRCPGCQTPVAREVPEVLARWRRGEGRQMSCPSCRETVALEALSYRPPAAPAGFAIELRDVHSLALSSLGQERFERLLGGPFHVIGSRG